MKKRKAILFSGAAVCLCICALVFFLGGRSGQNGQIDQPYRYPVVPGSEEWKALPDLPAKIAACEVDRELLESMTTSALLQTVLDYPLLVNIGAFNTTEIGVGAVSLYFPGIEILAGREDALEVIRAYKPQAGDTLSGFYLQALREHIEQKSLQ